MKFMLRGLIAILRGFWRVRSPWLALYVFSGGGNALDLRLESCLRESTGNFEPRERDPLPKTQEKVTQASTKGLGLARERVRSLTKRDLL